MCINDAASTSASAHHTVPQYDSREKRSRYNTGNGNMCIYPAKVFQKKPLKKKSPYRNNVYKLIKNEEQKKKERKKIPPNGHLLIVRTISHSHRH